MLGAAAGGGFPQWNSNAAACNRARRGDPSAPARTQASVAVSADGRTALSGSGDSSLKLWDLTTGKEIQTLVSNTNWPLSVAISGDGHTALSGNFKGGTFLAWDFSRTPAYLDFDHRVEQAQATLREKSDDPAALAVLGRWYAFRGKNDWALELLEKARTGGAAIDPLTLARCYWELSDDLPPKSDLTRARCLAAARREYARALDEMGKNALEKDKKEKQVFYLQLCLEAVERAAPTSTLQPGRN